MFKLIKYELKTTWKLYAVVFALWFLYGLLFAVLEPVLRMLGDIGELLLLMWGITTIPTLFLYMSFVTFGMPIISAMRFKRAYYSDKAYLLVPLPLSAHSHLLSRLLVSMIWTILAFSCYLLMFMFPGGIPFEFDTVFSFVQLTFILCYNYLHLYTAVIVGHSFKKCRTLLSIVFYFVTWILSVVFLVFVGHYLKSSSILPPQVMVFGIVTGAVYYIIAVRLFKKKLNVV